MINLNEIYDKQLNFLIGSGASFGLFPTLGLKIKDGATGRPYTIESLQSHPDSNEGVAALSLAYYLDQIIKPASEFEWTSAKTDVTKAAVLQNYLSFLTTLVHVVHRQPHFKRANIFTTNQDGIFAHAAEQLLRNQNLDFHLNDGGIGFLKRTLHPRAFSRFTKDHGVFDRSERFVPQINLVQPHGSVYWFQDGDRIEISYSVEQAKQRISTVPELMKKEFKEEVEKETGDIKVVNRIGASLDAAEVTKFRTAYATLPIVNPTKWKFHETLFEEHYYQSMRLMSYELEKPNTVFITFGFSFADEHILSLIQRSLSNPSLKFYVCCFTKDERVELERKLGTFPNVEFFDNDTDRLTFDVFNDKIFSLKNVVPAGGK